MNLYKYAEIYYKHATYHSWDWDIWHEICIRIVKKYTRNTSFNLEDVKKDTLKISHLIKKLEYFILDELVDKYKFPKEIFDNTYSEIRSVHDIISSILNDTSTEHFKYRLGMIVDYVEKIRTQLDRLHIPSYYTDSDEDKPSDDNYFFWQGNEFGNKMV